MPSSRILSRTIKKISEDDLPDVLAIETASSARPWSRGAFYEELNNPYSSLFGLKIGKRTSAFICVSHVLKEGHILKISVHPDFRRIGIATQLLEHALIFLKLHGCERVFLEVRAGNVPALELYRKFGFEEVRRRLSYYRNPVEDAIEMRLIFQE